MEAQSQQPPLSPRDQTMAQKIGVAVDTVSALVEVGFKKVATAALNTVVFCHVGKVTDLLSPSGHRTEVIRCSDPKCTSPLNPNNANPNKPAEMPPQVQKPSAK